MKMHSILAFIVVFAFCVPAVVAHNASDVDTSVLLQRQSGASDVDNNANDVDTVIPALWEALDTGMSLAQKITKAADVMFDGINGRDMLLTVQQAWENIIRVDKYAELMVMTIVKKFFATFEQLSGKSGRAFAADAVWAVAKGGPKSGFFTEEVGTVLVILSSVIGCKDYRNLPDVGAKLKMAVVTAVVSEVLMYFIGNAAATKSMISFGKAMHKQGLTSLQNTQFLDIIATLIKCVATVFVTLTLAGLMTTLVAGTGVAFLAPFVVPLVAPTIAADLVSLVSSAFTFAGVTTQSIVSFGANVASFGANVADAIDDRADRIAGSIHQAGRDFDAATKPYGDALDAGADALEEGVSNFIDDPMATMGTWFTRDKS